MDAVIATISRIRGNSSSPNAKAEVQHHVGALVRNYPHLLADLQFSEEPVIYKGTLGHPTRIGPNSGLHRVVEAFAARIALAIFRATVGEPAPSNARIICRWDTNIGLDSDDALEDFLKAMGLPRTLIQGKKHVADQFRFWGSSASDEKGLFGCFAAFRDAFGVVCFIDTTDGEPLFEPMFQPGFLQGFQV